jgi:hypothetical protein
MTDERRTHSRYSLPIECAWNGAGGFAETRISDLSLTGCYVDSSQVPVTGEPVEIHVTLDGVRVTLVGEVVHARLGMGFAARFDELDTPTQERLSSFLAATL